MRKIRLNRDAWEFNEDGPLAPPGGFGQVFEGARPEIAVKRLNVAAGQAKRELTLAETLAGRELPNVVPVFDAGEDAESGESFIVMARCQKNLTEYLKTCRPSHDEAVTIMAQIVAGLTQ